MQLKVYLRTHLCQIWSTDPQFQLECNTNLLLCNLKLKFTYNTTTQVIQVRPVLFTLTQRLKPSQSVLFTLIWPCTTCLYFLANLQPFASLFIIFPNLWHGNVFIPLSCKIVMTLLWDSRLANHNSNTAPRKSTQVHLMLLSGFTGSYLRILIGYSYSPV